MRLTFNRIIGFFLLVFLFSACTNHVDIERKQLFDFDWKFALGDYPEAIIPEFNKCTLIPKLRSYSLFPLLTQCFGHPVRPIYTRLKFA
ncbi:MAG: hypothetical protein PF436_11770 [Prolixibacteraceae bacterium]|jgi:hypothetical protein|nr:hypothetical protein [Prolixibacteraceae bacterium]